MAAKYSRILGFDGEAHSLEDSLDNDLLPPFELCDLVYGQRNRSQASRNWL